jgi:hypothetical protein
MKPCARYAFIPENAKAVSDVPSGNHLKFTKHTIMPKNLDPVSGESLPLNRNLLEVVTGASTELSAAQKTFKQLLAGVENTEAQLQGLVKLLDVYRPKFSQTLSPIQREYDAMTRDLVLRLDAQMHAKGRTKSQRETIFRVMAYLYEALAHTEFADEVEAILKKHQPADERATEELLMAQFGAEQGELFGAEFDSDLGEDDVKKEPRSPQELWEEAMRLMDEQVQKHQQEAEAHANQKRDGKKTAKQKKVEQENIDSTKLLKEIYRKLTSALHPDREPDDTERARKTALMVEVNKAYAANNLLQLMRLQFQTIKVDAAAAATLADEKLRLINRSLKQQFADLQQECYMLESMIRQEFNLPYVRAVTAKWLDKELAKAKAYFVEKNDFIRDEIKYLSRSEADFKNWLKDQKRMIDENDSFAVDHMLDDPFMQEILKPSKKRR